MIGIYKITNPNNEIYVGQSTNIENRWNKDYKTLRCKTQPKLYNSLKKYGPENHKFEIVEECVIEQLLMRETYYKNLYKVLEVPSLCCRTDGRFGHMSQETKDKISEGLLKANIKRSKIIKENISKNLRRKIYQFNLSGELIKIWEGLIDAEKQHKGNINRCLMGLTKCAGGYIWLREKELYKLEDKISQIKKYVSPLTNKKLSKEHKDNLSKSIIGKKTKCKTDNLNLEVIQEQYKTLSTNQLAKIYNLSIPTMLNYLKDKEIYKFRKNYNK
jgi:group I intron endonuclease